LKKAGPGLDGSGTVCSFGRSKATGMRYFRSIDDPFRLMTVDPLRYAVPDHTGVSDARVTIIDSPNVPMTLNYPLSEETLRVHFVEVTKNEFALAAVLAGLHAIL
jgi:hypothetical protein